MPEVQAMREYEGTFVTSPEQYREHEQRLVAALEIAGFRLRRVRSWLQTRTSVTGDGCVREEHRLVLRIRVLTPTHVAIDTLGLLLKYAGEADLISRIICKFVQQITAASQSKVSPVNVDIESFGFESIDDRTDFVDKTSFEVTQEPIPPVLYVIRPHSANSVMIRATRVNELDPLRGVETSDQLQRMLKDQPSLVVDTLMLDVLCPIPPRPSDSMQVAVYHIQPATPDEVEEWRQLPVLGPLSSHILFFVSDGRRAAEGYVRGYVLLSNLARFTSVCASDSAMLLGASATGALRLTPVAYKSLPSEQSLRAKA